MENQTLLEKAKKVKKKGFESDTTKEEMELAIAWARGEITWTQASQAIYAGKVVNTCGTYSKLAVALKNYIQENEL